MRLSKSQYLRGLQCEKSLWLYNHRRELIPPAPPALQIIFDQGHEVGRLAHQLYPGGVEIKEDHPHLPQALKSTEAALNSGAATLYEPAFLYKDVLVRPDILVQAPDGSWDLIEVKASSGVKDVYIDDAAIQKYVLEGAGFPVRSAAILHIDTAYVRQGEIEPRRLFKLADITAQVVAQQLAIPAVLKRLFKTLAAADEPAIDVGPQCTKPYDCQFADYCWKAIPDDSIYNLRLLRWEKKLELRDQGILRMKDVPPDYPLTEAQRIQVELAQNGGEHLDARRIKRFLSTLEYPAHFLDFESINPAIPPFDGLRAFQQIPFQASVRIVKEPAAPPLALSSSKHLSGVIHEEFLGDGRTDPRPGLAKFLCDVIGPKGSIVAFNAPFERGRIEELAEAVPKYSKPLHSMAARLWDLADPFRRSHYVRPEFNGSYSIKAVLPVMVPGMSYEGLKIKAGDEAQAAYIKLMGNNLKPAERAAISEALKEYCGQDTEAMARILEILASKVA